MYNNISRGQNICSWVYFRNQNQPKDFIKLHVSNNNLVNRMFIIVKMFYNHKNMKVKSNF